MITLRIDKKVHEQYKKHCKEKGISMSSLVRKYIELEVKRLPKHNGNRLNKTVTLSVDEKLADEYSKICDANGLVMSKRIEQFMERQLR